uniref:Uncharacterized protein n=1 Tax=Arundo donax TaxID=35708 RepID=A0A0A9EZ60_ARUDO
MLSCSTQGLDAPNLFHDDAHHSRGYDEHVRCCQLYQEQKT